MTASIVGLLAPNSLYGKETSTLADAATAQDLVGLVIVGPLLLVMLRSASGRSSVHQRR